MSRSWRRWLIITAVAAAVMWGVREPLAVRIGAHLVQEDPIHLADAIVVLGGDARSRAPHGADLYSRGLAPLVLAVGGTDPNGTHTQAQKTARVLMEHGVPSSRILIAGQYEASTLLEAQATADYATDRSWRSVIVVTSPYHTRRAGTMFHDVLDPMGVEVMVSAARDDPYDPQTWWRDARQRRQVRNEYLKHALWTLVGQ